MKSPASPRLELRAGQSQSLVMTQQLQQSIKLLQMTAQEVQAFVDQQLEENPFLEAEETPEGDAADELPPAGDENPESDAEPDAEPAANIADAPDEHFQPDDWRDEASLHTPITPRDREGDVMDFAETRARDITLCEHLMAQLQVQSPDPLTSAIGIRLIDLVDEAGYIREDLGQLATQLGTEMEHVEQALSLVQTFDPAGVGARNVPECLALQLRDRDRYDPAMQAMVANLHLLAAGNLDPLMRLCGVDMEDLRGMITEIRSLNPKPGLQFSHEAVQGIVPDVSMRRDAAGKWHIELNTSALPRVLVNRRYYAKVSPGAKGVDRKFITERLHEANWLVKALDQRAHTILKVATSIVVQQDGFFRMGIHHLRPLTLKDIARETGFHESTVSRVTSGKYLITPRGTYELKYFFTSGLSHKAGGDDVSSQTVKHLIREMIEKETDVLSDDDIAGQLKAKNINVARRTVAKYREALHIPSSMERRRQKRMRVA